MDGPGIKQIQLAASKQVAKVTGGRGCWMPRTGLLCLLSIALIGCGSGTTLDDAELADLDFGKELPTADEVPAAPLKLELRPGQRFPLIKTVSQRLLQGPPPGKQVGSSEIELLLAIIVEQRDGDQTRLRVQYERARYSHEIAGQTVVFDSTQPQGPVPPEAAAYAGMVQNGFSFWMGPDQRVSSVVDFPAFIERCLSRLPEQQKQLALNQLTALSAEDGLANFVDESLGLLPAPEAQSGKTPEVYEGYTWSPASRAWNEGDAAATKTTCRVTSLSAKEAAIDLQGFVSPTTTRSGNQAARVTITGGQCRGSCRIDRRTGLPTQSRIEKSVEMKVQLVNQQEISQRKDVLSTLQVYFDQAEQVNHGSAGNSSADILPAGYEDLGSGKPAAGGATRRTSDRDAVFP